MVEVRPIASLEGAQLAWTKIASSQDPARLTEEERAIFATLKSDKRRAEWWSGRIAAKAALEATGIIGASVLADERGAPMVVGAGSEGAHVSISHGRRIAAAVACRRGVRHPCVGIDIVDREDDERIRKIAYRVLTDDEHALLAREPLAALLAWGTREAIAKATSTGMFMFALSGAPIAGVDRDRRRVLTKLEGIEVVFEALEDGGVLVFAGATLEAAAAARATASVQAVPEDASEDA